MVNALYYCLTLMLQKSQKIRPPLHISLSSSADRPSFKKKNVLQLKMQLCSCSSLITHTHDWAQLAAVQLPGFEVLSCEGLLDSQSNPVPALYNEMRYFFSILTIACDVISRQLVTCHTFTVISGHYINTHLLTSVSSGISRLKGTFIQIYVRKLWLLQHNQRLDPRWPFWPILKWNHMHLIHINQDWYPVILLIATMTWCLGHE